MNVYGGISIAVDLNLMEFAKIKKKWIVNYFIGFCGQGREISNEYLSMTFLR